MSDKEKSAFNFLSIYLGVDTENERDVHLLLRAIKYAGIEYFVEKPHSLKQAKLKEIFLVKAYYYFERAKTNDFRDKTNLYNLQVNEINQLRKSLY